MEENYNREEIDQSSQSNTPIHGWLVFFCIVLGLGGVIGFASNLLQGDLYEDYGGSPWLLAVDVSVGFIGLLIAAYSIYAIIKRKSNAVFYAKAYVVMVFVTNLLFLLFDLTDESSIMTSVSHTIGSLVWGVIWFLYLTFSEQVNTRFPKEERKVKAKDWLLALSMVYVPLAFMLIFWLHGDFTTMALKQSVNEINSEMIEGLDRVAYDETANIYTFYFCIDDDEKEALSSRDEIDLKTMLMSEMLTDDDEDVEEFFSLLKKTGTTLRYVFQTPSGEKVKVVDFAPDELGSVVSAEQERESALNMIEKEAEEANAECPYKVDEWITWNSCTFDRQSVCMTFMYSINMKRKDLDKEIVDELKEESKANLIETCRDNSIYKTAGLKIKVEYRDIDDQFIDQTTINSNDY